MESDNISEGYTEIKKLNEQLLDDDDLNIEETEEVKEKIQVETNNNKKLLINNILRLLVLFFVFNKEFDRVTIKITGNIYSSLLLKCLISLVAFHFLDKFLF